jgi:hypothetical protein
MADTITRFGIIGMAAIEKHSPQFSIAPTIRAFLDKGGGKRLFVVVDNEKFSYHGELRPLAEEPWALSITYGNLYSRVQKWFSEHGCPFPLRDSKTPYFQFQAVAYHRVSGERCETIEALFEAFPKAPYSHFWDDLGRCLGYGIDLPSLRTPEITEFISRNVELAPDSQSLRGFCTRLFGELRPLLSPSYRRGLQAHEWLKSDRALDELDQLKAQFTHAAVGNHGTEYPI